MTIQIPTKIKVHEDKKTKVKTVAIPLGFPDGTQGAVMVTKFTKEDWIPSKEIKHIHIEFYD